MMRQFDFGENCFENRPQLICRKEHDPGTDCSDLLWPFITGNGNVSRGAQEVFEHLPHKWVQPEDLPHLEPSRSMVYGVVAEEEHSVRKLDGSPLVDRAEFYAFPERFKASPATSSPRHRHVVATSLTSPPLSWFCP